MLDTLDISRVLRSALAGGGEFADIYFEEGSSTTVVCEDGKIEKVLAATDRGVGIRVISDLRTAYAYTNETTEEALLSLAETVSRAVKGQQFDRPIDLRRKVVGAGFSIEMPPSTVSLKDKVLLVTRAEQAARGADGRVRQVMVVYRDGEVSYQMANSLGEFVETSRTGTVFMAQVVAAAGDVIQTGYEPLGGFRGYELFREKSPEEIAITAARRAVMMLSARKAPAGPMPVVLSAEAGGTMVHEAIGHGLEADLAQTGLLRETLVIVTGEFGRTPRINRDAGRDHWGPVMSLLLAGGGIRGGTLIGATDRNSAYPIAERQTPENLAATLYAALGIPQHTSWHDTDGRPYELYRGEPIAGIA